MWHLYGFKQTLMQSPSSPTACEHQRNLLEHRAREAGVPAGRVYLPQCDPAGAFLPTQCHPATLTCWCVDTQGQEVPGTRVSQPAQPNCQVSDIKVKEGLPCHISFCQYVMQYI